MKKNIIIIVLSLALVATTSYIIFEKTLTSKENSNQAQETENEKKKTENEKNESENKVETTTKDVPKCTGTYHGEYTEEINRGITLTTNLNYTYILDENNHYKATFGDVQTQTGSFYINGNTITFIHPSEISAPADEYPNYYSENYLLADDCSTIKVFLDYTSAKYMTLYKK